MEDNVQPLTQPAVAEMTESSSEKNIVGNTLESMLRAYYEKQREAKHQRPMRKAIYLAACRAWSEFNSFREATRLDSPIMDLDKLSTLDDYCRLASLQNERIRRDAALFAQVRQRLSELDELLALEKEIRTTHGSELNKLSRKDKKRFEKASRQTSGARHGYITTYRNVLYDVSRLES